MVPISAISSTVPKINLDPLGLLSFLTGVLAILAFAMFVVHVRRTRGARRFALMLLWLGHAALYWCTNMVMRLFFGYEGPSAAMTMWASTVQMQGFLSLIGYVLVRRQYLHSRRDADDMD